MCFSKHIFKSNYFVAEDTRQVYEGKVTKMSNTWYVVIKSIPPICTEKLYPKILYLYIVLGAVPLLKRFRVSEKWYNMEKT